MLRPSCATLLLALTVASASSTEVACNARELRDLLTPLPPVELKSATVERDCGLSGCRMKTERMIIRPDSNHLRQAEGGEIRLKTYQSDDGLSLPDLDWDPLGSYQVFSAGRRWGSCLEFSHAGLGKSGSWQRWSSVLLLPWKNSRPGRMAYRFAGYWLGCDFLTPGDRPGEIVLHAVEPVAASTTTLRIVQHHCDASDCHRMLDGRQVAPVPGSGTGALSVEATARP